MFQKTLVADTIVIRSEHHNGAPRDEEAIVCTPDAWISDSSIRTGSEISFARCFFISQSLRMLAEIETDIRALEFEAEGLLDQILVSVEGGGKP